MLLLPKAQWDTPGVTRTCTKSPPPHNLAHFPPCVQQTLTLEPAPHTDPICSAHTPNRPGGSSQAPAQCPAAVAGITPSRNILPALKPRGWRQRCQKEKSLLSLGSQLLPLPCQAHNHSWLFFICIYPHGDSKARSLQHRDVVSPTVKDKKHKTFICSTDLLSWSSRTHRGPGLLRAQSMQENTDYRSFLPFCWFGITTHEVFKPLLITGTSKRSPSKHSPVVPWLEGTNTFQA